MTRSEINEIKSLATAKGRKQMGAFLSEGTRCVLECLPCFKVRRLLATAAWIAEHPGLGAEQVEQRDIDRMSAQSSPQPVMAVFEIPQPTPYIYKGELTLALDAIQDPGNLGTIIRLADWFGIRHILAGAGTADCWAPKVVQATMGALGRVEVHRVECLAETLKATGAPVMGTFLHGENLYKAELPRNPILVMGNEGNGISEAVEAVCTQRVTIPPFPPEREAVVESLNVAMATGIIVSELSRRIYG